MSYIADTFHLPKRKIEIIKNQYGWYITDVPDCLYLHKDGVWHPTMSRDNGPYQYHDTKQSAIDLCEKYNYNYVVDRGVAAMLRFLLDI